MPAKDIMEMLIKILNGGIYLEPVIAAKDLVKEYNGKAAVKGVNFSVNQRECFGILGPNGAGKSSIAKMIYCFSPVTQGDLLVLGMNVREKQRSIKERLGVVPQENNLDTDLTVIENLIVYGSFFRIPTRTVQEKSEEMLDFFELLDYRNEKVDKLSGGMKRRLTIARALINSPQILILDEPTTGLDPQARHLVWQRLRRLKEQGVTLLLTTHYMDEAEHLCDHLVVIDDGVILEEGQPKELVQKHIGYEVLEIGRGAENFDEILKAGGTEIKGYKIVGDMLFVYPEDGQTLIDRLRPFSDSFSHQMLRHANLEDVFLKLTGRGLVE